MWDPEVVAEVGPINPQHTLRKVSVMLISGVIKGEDEYGFLSSLGS